MLPTLIIISQFFYFSFAGGVAQPFLPERTVSPAFSLWMGILFPNQFEANFSFLVATGFRKRGTQNRFSVLSISGQGGLRFDARDFFVSIMAGLGPSVVFGNETPTFPALGIVGWLEFGVPVSERFHIRLSSSFHSFLGRFSGFFLPILARFDVLAE